MAISFVNPSISTTATGAIPTGTIAGDFMIASVLRGGGNVPATPSGWTAHGIHGTVGSNSLKQFWKIYAPGDSNPTSGSADGMQICSYRGVASIGSPINMTNNTTPLRISALTLTGAPSWVHSGYFVLVTPSGAIPTPAGMVERSEGDPGGGMTIGTADTGADVTSWAQVNRSYSAFGGWVSITSELIPAADSTPQLAMMI